MAEREKRAKAVTMTARSKKWLEKQGYVVALVERSLWLPKRVNGVETGEKFFQKFDCFGFADLVACHPDRIGTVFVQTTTSDHAAERREKIRGLPAAQVVLRGQNLIQVHGWSKKGAKNARKLWQVNVFEYRLLKNGRFEFVNVGDVEVEDDGTTVASMFPQGEPSLLLAVDDDF